MYHIFKEMCVNLKKQLADYKIRGLQRSTKYLILALSAGRVCAIALNCFKINSIIVIEFTNNLPLDETCNIEYLILPTVFSVVMLGTISHYLYRLPNV